MFHWQGGGLPSVYRVLQRFRTCGAKQLRDRLHYQIRSVPLFLCPQWSPLTGGGQEGEAAGRGPPHWPHAGRWGAALSPVRASAKKPFNWAHPKQTWSCLSLRSSSEKVLDYQLSVLFIKTSEDVTLKTKLFFRPIDWLGTKSIDLSMS